MSDRSARQIDRSPDSQRRSVSQITDGGQISRMAIISAKAAPIISDYLRHQKTRGLSKKTQATARSILHNLAVTCGGRDLLTLTATDLQEWQQQRADQLAPRSLRTQTSYVIVFYRWAVAEGRISLDPTARLVTPKVPRLLPKPIAEGDLSDALNDADRQMAAILALAAFCGLRAAEIADLDWRDVHLTGPEPVLHVVGKGARERVVDLSPEMVRILRRLPQGRGVVIRRRDGRPGRNTPNRISQAAGRYLRAHGIRESLHCLRHRAGTVWYRLGGIRAAQELLGHASVSTTGGYAAIARRELRPVAVAAGTIQDETRAG